MNPEANARQKIDTLLLQCGWTVQDYKTLNLSASRGVALREVPLKKGRCDYLLLVDRKAVGIVEAKSAGTTLSGVADQSAYYGDNLPELFQVEGRLPFLYESTGAETFFRDERDPHPRSRRVFAFHRPETLAAWMQEEHTLRHRLAQMPFAHPLATRGMRDCQTEAITALEQSFAHDRPRSLIQMATGAGKTFTACAFIYRLIKYADARKVLFLVDRANLGRQATSEFHNFVTPDTGRKFTELYNVQHLQSNHIDDVSRVTICTIQRLYSMLRGEELDAEIEEHSTYEVSAVLSGRSGVPPLDHKNMRQDAASTSSRSLEVIYNPAIPIEEFDFIVTDECHRSIYNLWRQVLEYFDASLIGLTATPSKQTLGFFNGNLVTEYNHERAVADGVNVGYEVYRIQTDVTEKGGKVEKGLWVDRRSKLTRKKRWEQLDEDLEYSAKELDRSVVVPSQIRTVLQAFKDALETELFPGRAMVPKTLIFAKDDSHAEDIVHAVWEVFGRGNDFAKKITYRSTKWQRHPAADSDEKSGGTPLPRVSGEKLIQEFRTSPQLRIAVTVDMVATGTDIKPLECLLFMRDVRSQIYFEQMKGRGTRVLSPTDLQAVSGEDARAKTHFVIVDAVGVCEGDKTDSRPLERKPSISFHKLLMAVALGQRDEDTLTTLASRLARLDRAVSEKERQQLESVTQKPIAEMASALLRAVNPDEIEAEVEAASRRLMEQHEQDQKAELGNYFNELAPVAFQTGNLPHWRQEGVTYFVTFRLADSLPAEKLAQWRQEREAWLQQQNVEAASRRLSSTDEIRRQDAASAEYQKLFSARIEAWLDQGSGSCVLDIPECHEIVETALRFFDGERYALGEFVVAPNHVHVIVAPREGYELSDILHSWKSFTAKEILKVEEASRRLGLNKTEVEAASCRLDVIQRAGTAPQTSGETPLPPRRVWQKESFDHIIRNADSLARIEEYIRAHKVEEPSPFPNLEELRRDAAATLVQAACAPFDDPDVREVLITTKQQTEITIDTVTADNVLSQGFDAAAKEKAQSLISTFKAYLAEHREEIAALSILYSRPYRQRLTETMLKELESKLRETDATWHEDTLWRAFETVTPERVRGKTQVDRFADLVPMVRFALEQQEMLEPFADSVRARFEKWMEQKESASGSGVSPLNEKEHESGVSPNSKDKSREGISADKRRDAASTFSAEQRVWLELIRDHIATTLSIEPEDFDYAPFSQQGGLGKAWQLFGEELTPLLDELNEVLAA